MLMNFRKIAVLACLSVSSLLFTTASLAADAPLKVGMLIPGQIDDGGFMEAGYNGLLAIRDELGAEIVHIADVKPEEQAQIEALESLAEGQPDLILAHGGQNSAATVAVSKKYPDISFVVIQGNVTGDNLSSYEVLQEESAWLAGAAAGLLTKTNVVGHMSGIKVPPGLKGRGAFYNGLKHTNPEAKFLTTFVGDQDDEQLAYDGAQAEIEAGADIIFTMLNAGRSGATKAMREGGVKEVGNVVDWVAIDPEVFIGSAVANVSKAALVAARDFANGKWEAGKIVQIGLDDPSAVSLVLGADIPDGVQVELDTLSEAIVTGKIDVSVEYDGEEFDFPRQ